VSAPRTPVSKRALGIGAVIAVAAVVLVAAIVVYGFPSKGGSSPTPSGIEILPSGGTGSRCITGTPGVPRPSLPLAEGAFQANTYNVPNGTTGHIGMCYNAATGSMFAYANWTRVGPAGGWFSYPQLTYGVADWLGPFSTYTNQSPSWILPQPVHAITNEDVWVTAGYRLNAPGPADVDGYDLSFDNFLTESLPPYFEVGPFVEVEVFLAHNISYPFRWIPWQTETLVNATLVDAPWDVAYWCHGPDNSSNDNVSFDFSYDGQATHGLAAGTIGVNLSALLVEVESLMPAVSCWDGPTQGFSNFYLGDTVLGSEDGALGGASFDYNWTVDDYCLHPEAGIPSVSGVSCA
jgi:hypothetical protein